MSSNFLERILATKRNEIAVLKDRVPQITAQRALPPSGFATQIQSAKTLAVVAEVKKASPSKGLIQPNFQPVETGLTYERAGASCISVLTDAQYFMGSTEILERVRQSVTIPVLRKDFIIDEVQVDEAYHAGADALLLICAALSPSRLRELSTYTRGLGMDVLIEIHSEAELDAALAADASVIGVNNRDLTTFEVRLETSEHLIPLVPAGIPTLAESGIGGAADAMRMAACGASGILVGESLMRAGTGNSIAEALQSLQVAKSHVGIGES
ncbi:indole-3-glycerol phosphate synthase TrpC [Alicyclobacillus ferrooxydans]|uniref:Indole-3-glycerol phosphate synthase n=1 Tax=Alicyclobacillus ferrooxydans TaxID=471514 RepID=A0A0P9CGK4_9BACL|nr:indole-3-glycerol phosphate synthase TrpC [Alicyclobacillus ferrooxydans]KPV44874.1 hypothetical protein AN477_05160 [Alicyclobacillus ferrooxydans]